MSVNCGPCRREPGEVAKVVLLVLGQNGLLVFFDYAVLYFHCQ
jgi:hypothetical protein